MAFSLIVTLGNQMNYTTSKFGVSAYIKGSPRFLCCPMAFFLLDPWDVRELSIRKTADLPLQLLVGTFPRLSDFIFYQKPLYKSPHQSFFYSFITILPSESSVTLHYNTILPQLDPIILPFDFHFDFFSNICHVTSRKRGLPQCIMGDDLHINKQTNICIANHRRLLRQNN